MVERNKFKKAMTTQCKVGGGDNYTNTLQKGEVI